jgi:hypothetical protein
MISAKDIKSISIHPLARFITVEAIGLILNISPKDIYRISCWRYVIHVVGKGIGRFVSYADIPPILTVERPTRQDTIYWRKRWRKNRGKAPHFWRDFYQQKLEQSLSLEEIEAWKQLIEKIEFAFSNNNLQYLSRIVSSCRAA